ncbi:MAG: glycosyltransferase family 9 protein [Gammaproteobacteria bacterium]|nr:glycosyltransferase family 9 protein [Gammaproteobacteria bacterium]
MPSLLVYVIGDRLGDGMLKLPLIRALRGAFPNHRIVWMAGWRKSVFKGPLAPLVTGLIDEVREEAGLGVSLRELLRRPLAAERFDIVIDTQQRLVTTLVLRRIPHDLFVSPAARFRLSDRRPATPRPHSVTARLLQLFELAAGRPLQVDPVVRVDEAFERAAAALLPAGPRYLGFAPGAGGARKRWPLERFIDLAARFAARGCVPVFFLGPDEAAWRERIAAAVPAARFPEHEGGQRAGPLLAVALGARLAAAVSNDAGPGHLLAASGIPVLTLFGRTAAGKFAAAPNRHVLRAADFGGDDVACIPVDAVAGRIELLLRPAPPA